MAAMFKTIGGVAFGFMLPILAGFIAMSIADRPGLAVGFVGGAIAANGTSGFLGALAAGFLAGYVVLLLKKICSKLPDSLEGTKPVLIYPLFGIFIVGILMTYVVEPPIGALNTLINNGLNGLNGASAVLLGALLGGMMSVDMGGRSTRQLMCSVQLLSQPETITSWQPLWSVVWFHQSQSHLQP